MKAELLFATWPYIALSLLIVGIGVRYLLDRRQMNLVMEEISEVRALFAGGRVWLFAALLLGAAHVLLLFLPRAVLAWNISPVRLYLLEGLLLAAGIVLLVKCLAVARRQVGHGSRSAITELSDTIFLSLLLLGILSGVLMALFFRWGSTWGAMTLAPYLTSMARGRPAAAFVAQMPYLVRLHVFSAFVALAVFPLTRLAAFPVAAIQRTLALIYRPLGALGHASGDWLRKHNPASWLWPEED